MNIEIDKDYFVALDKLATVAANMDNMTPEMESALAEVGHTRPFIKPQDRKEATGER